MSIHALSWVLRFSEEQLGRRLVLIVLADHAKDDGTMAWPSVGTIANQARLSRRSVQNALRELEKAGAIVRRGESQAGTVIYDVVMQAPAAAVFVDVAHRGADSAPGADGGAGGAQSATSGGAKSAPEPSVQQPSKSSRQGKKILSPAEEPIGFSEWLGFHHELTGSAVPRAGTSRRDKLARVFAELVGQGAALDDFRLESEGVFASPHMREGGHLEPENVLRKSRFGEYAEKGRRARRERETQAASPYAQFDGGDPRV